MLAHRVLNRIRREPHSILADHPNSDFAPAPPDVVQPERFGDIYFVYGLCLTSPAHHAKPLLHWAMERPVAFDALFGEVRHAAKPAKPRRCI
jgi:hypothetical protein